MSRPPEITPAHLNRVAILFDRGSFSAGDNSLAIERALIDCALAWGWSEDLILVLDEASGPSGVDPDRGGFRLLCQLIEAGRVGLVLAEDLTRIAPSPEILRSFARLCQQTGTLVAVHGVLWSGARTAAPIPVSPASLQASEPVGRAFETLPSGGKFPLGRLLATPGALRRLTPADILSALARHAAGDWGDLGAADRAENELSLREGFRLFSAYHSAAGARFWIISEADRSATTVLLPEEY